ncbi:MAG: hypothetical protein EAZ14_03880 [Runella slithyformis]|jgi:hypothetical protein|nr:MAG: hypothetical protein EAZ80_12710 [Runella slithyformis]TAG19165.1 MAG: hypothetical protein EAZ38_13090 [Cytophagales bacterium]TAG38446.1 MAG: hypothetical protein EAZ32_12455 [Cytophagia bacterium]TAG53577.1 MAG: hypothetical protein EAZ29_05480 [Runella slithyformis]TAG67610.1 MAG: hypothetical protein EAZ26_08735 [Runella slithyformis]
MNQERYAFETDITATVYEFVSEGKSGRVNKLIEYLPIEENEVYNLGFVDIDPTTGELSDTIRTNNGDSQKVLATVAATVLDFTDRYAHVSVFAKGSTPARTRLYQMGIANNLNEIQSEFEVLGYTNSKWCDFEKGINYEAFLVKRKQQTT